MFRKWDLHIHTPDSLVHNFSGKTSEEQWESWLADVERLPPEVAVLGINDYLFIDGYERVIREKAAGRLANITTVFPVIELRIRMFGGSGSSFSRINLHVIFDDNLDPRLIREQFLSQLATKFQLDQKVSWSGVLTKDSLADLGQALIETAPPGKQKMGGGDLARGFANLTFDDQTIRGILQDNSYLSEHYLIGLGKTEWDELRWDQAAADKRHCANTSDLLFIASENEARYFSARQKLDHEAITIPLFDCSDAHHNAGTAQKDRIGNCLTWVKADPTFAGLRFALKTPWNRLYIGATPPIDRRVAEHPSQTMSALSIKKSPVSSGAGHWFDAEMPLNPGLVAIIGNKGSGKSALADIVGLAANTSRNEYFSFLTTTKFRNHQTGRAKDYEARVVWADGAVSKANLDRNNDSALPEGLNYLPQRFLETLCNDTTGAARTPFDEELESVIFSHVPEEDRLGKQSLSELILYKTQLIGEKQDRLRQELKVLTRKLATIDERLQPAHRQKLVALLEQAKTQLLLLKGQEPKTVADPASDPLQHGAQQALSQEIQVLLGEQQELVRTLTLHQSRRIQATKSASILERAQRTIDNFSEYVTNLKREFASDNEFQAEQLSIDDLIAISVDTSTIETRHAVLKEQIAALTLDLDPASPQTAANHAAEIEARIETLKTKLDLPFQEHHAYLAAHDAWQKRTQALIGSPHEPESIDGLGHQIALLDLLPNEQEQVIESIKTKIGQLHDALSEHVSEYRCLYGSVEQFIARHELAQRKLQLHFDVRINVHAFQVKFFEYISQGVTGSFYGVEEGRAVVERLLDMAEFQTKDGTIAFIQQVIDHLQQDCRQSPPVPVALDRQLRQERTKQELFEFLFGLEYLRPKFVLQWAKRSISQLSPGEKGALLLVFYLLIDKRASPLIIDQPEDNLDNETVYGVLVPAIAEARSRRQILLVTHNPNLAVAADADQIIRARHDKVAGKITYVTGGLEHPTIAGAVIDVLEGTRPAFSIREQKYLIPTSV